MWTEREFERLKSLYDRDLVAAADRDRAWQAFEVARMQERTAREQLALVMAGPRSELVEAARAEARQARERLRLVEAGPRPDQVEAARAEVRVARERLALVEAGPRPGQVDTVRAQLAQAEATLVQARARLADTRIEAPMDGVVLRKSLDSLFNRSASARAPRAPRRLAPARDVPVGASVRSRATTCGERRSGISSPSGRTTAILLPAAARRARPVAPPR